MEPAAKANGCCRFVAERQHGAAERPELRLEIVAYNMAGGVYAAAQNRKQSTELEETMTSALALALQQQPDMRGPLGALFGGTTLLVMLAVLAIFVVGMWKVFTKAGQPGWAVLIPIFNAYILLKIVGRPGWWLVLYLIPVVNLVVAAIVSMDLAKSFGYSAVFGFILLFLAAGIGYLILGFGSARYVGPSATPRISAAVA